MSTRGPDTVCQVSANYPIVFLFNYLQELAPSVWIRPDIRCYVMTSIVHWPCKLAKSKVVELIQKHFYELIVFYVMEQLAELAGLDKPKTHKDN